MKYRRLGRTNLQVSQIGFGCWAIGGTSYGPTRDEDSLLALETAWEHGVNVYDTADTYGHGHSETLVARFLKGKPRDKIFIATKAGWDFYSSGGSRKNFDPDYLRFACGESLKRLQIDTIDLYQLHNPSVELMKRGEIVGVLEALKQEGKIRFIGISIHTQADAFAAMEDPRVDTLQLVFNFLDQKMAQQIFPEAQAKEIGILAREPLACGLLTGKYKPGHEFHKMDHRRRWMKEKLAADLEKVERVKENCRGVLSAGGRIRPTRCGEQYAPTKLNGARPHSTVEMSLPQAMLEYVLAFPEVSTVIPGAKTKEQVLENLKAALEPVLKPEDFRELKQLYQEEIFKQVGSKQ